MSYNVYYVTLGGGSTPRDIGLLKIYLTTLLDTKQKILEKKL